MLRKSGKSCAEPSRKILAPRGIRNFQRRIRQEGRNLTIERVRFIDNENGILGGPSPDSTVIIRNSVFERNGVCLYQTVASKRRRGPSGRRGG